MGTVSRGLSSAASAAGRADKAIAARGGLKKMGTDYLKKNKSNIKGALLGKTADGTATRIDGAACWKNDRLVQMIVVASWLMVMDLISKNLTMFQMEIKVKIYLWKVCFATLRVMMRKINLWERYSRKGSAENCSSHRENMLK